MPGTDLAYAGTRLSPPPSRRRSQVAYRPAISLRARYAMPGTDLAYAATRPLWHLPWCAVLSAYGYGMRSTEIAYGGGTAIA
eukprot:45564-Rhodomonas_salina.5